MREFYLNPDFDASLRGRPSLLETDDATFAHEMAWHFLFAGSAADSVIVHRALPEDFLAYLGQKGLALPKPVLHPAHTPAAEFTPFGWNGHTEALALRYDRQTPHPDPETIRIANSRAFSLGVEQGRKGSDPGSPDAPGSLFVTLEALEAFLSGRTEAEGWVVKGDHGHAGTANRRVPAGPLGPEDRPALKRLFDEHGRVVAEPWHDRLLDMSVNFTLDAHGGMHGFRGHQLLNSRDGAFLGVKILPSRLPPDPWAEPLRASAAALAQDLAGLGYSGPVGVDAYVWNSQQGPRLRPVVDINARQSMALPAHGLAQRLPGKTLLWMWAKPRKLNLPEGYRDLDRRLGPHAFDKASGTGILAVSPLRLQGGTAAPAKPDRSLAAKPKRVGFLFSAEGEERLSALQSAFAAALGRG